MSRRTVPSLPVALSIALAIQACGGTVDQPGTSSSGASGAPAPGSASAPPAVTGSQVSSCPAPKMKNDAACPATNYRDYRGKPCLPVGLVCSYAGDGIDGYCSSTAGLVCQSVGERGDGGLDSGADGGAGAGAWKVVP